MESVKDMIILTGLLSLAGLWGVCLIAGTIAMWESFGDPIVQFIGRIKRLFGG